MTSLSHLMPFRLNSSLWYLGYDSCFLLVPSFYSNFSESVWFCFSCTIQRIGLCLMIDLKVIVGRQLIEAFEITSFQDTVIRISAGTASPWNVGRLYSNPNPSNRESTTSLQNFFAQSYFPHLVVSIYFRVIPDVEVKSFTGFHKKVNPYQLWVKLCTAKIHMSKS